MLKFAPVIAVLLVTTSPVSAKGIFDGSWKGDMKASTVSTKPSVILIDAGMYTCSTCKPVVHVPADGAFHPVVGNPYYEELSVGVVNPTTVKRTMRKAGKTVGESTVTLAADGKTSSSVFNDMSADNGIAVTGTSVAERVASGPVGSHALSGSWRPTTDGQMSDSGLLFTVAQSGKVVTYTTPTGISYVTTIGGPASAVTGDPGWTTVSLKEPKTGTLVETDYHDGKAIGVYTMTLSADGQTMTTAVDDIKFGRKSTMVAHKQ